MLMIALFLPLYSAWPGETWLNKGQINVQLLLLTIKYIQPQAFIRASSLPIYHPKENSPSASCSLDQIRNSKSRSALQRPVSSAQVFIFLLRLFTLKTNRRGPCPWHWEEGNVHSNILSQAHTLSIRITSISPSCWMWCMCMWGGGHTAIWCSPPSSLFTFCGKDIQQLLRRWDKHSMVLIYQDSK